MRRIRWGDVLLSAVAAVGWALIAMAGVAGVGLHLLGADAAGGSLGPMTAAVVVLAIGGTVDPSGDVSVFGVAGAGAETSLDVMPLGVSLAGALVLAGVFLRSLRAGAGPGETAARVVAFTALLVATAGGLAWAGHDVVTLDGASLPGTPVRVEVPGIGDIGGLLPDRVADLVEARTRVGFSVEPGATLLGAGVWALAVLAVALLVSRRGPAVLARVRPAASAVVTVLLVAVAAGLAAAVWAAAGDEHPRRVLGAALLGAPNGSWLGVLLGLFVPLRGGAAGEPARLLPDPLDDLLSASLREPVTVAGLAEYDERVWLLVAGVWLLLLAAGVLAAVRTPGRGVAGCAVRLGAVTGVALAVLVRLTRLSADASLAVLGVDMVDAGVELRGDVPYALLLGSVWGALAGAAGAVLAGRRRAACAAAGAPGGAAGAGRAAPVDPGAPTAPHGAGPGAPGGTGGPGAPGGTGGPPGWVVPYLDPDVSWDVTVTGIPPHPPRRTRPPQRPPFTPPPPPGAPPPPKPPGPPAPPR
ncbi:streptophobe family protein [Streptomyces sp. NRRL F-4474]|uniref:streptophobe family protein n=1 Tax=Streptomyces sp. NRRL F-4474 TaxID=1463851 RepID=UPI0022772038|nr:streptophobe family protein [Streptomyces sp. NRRL F-4474]